MATIHTTVLVDEEKALFKEAFHTLLISIKEPQRSTIADEMVAATDQIICNAAYYKFKLFDYAPSDSLDEIETIMYSMIHGRQIHPALRLVDYTWIARDMAAALKQAIIKNVSKSS